MHRYARVCRLLFAALVLLTYGTEGGVPLFSQGPPTDNATLSATRAKQTAVRDAFIDRARVAGFTCSTPPPTIVVEDVPSFGNYAEGNRLRTSDWTLLQPQERALFFHLAGPGADEAAAHALFEGSVHHWVFVHEMGHWWEDCSHAYSADKPYANEYLANRLALAYWREVDPAFAAKMVTLFQGMVASLPSPVPAGEDVETFFNKNYETLGPSPVYPWFQARMIVAAAAEAPEPSFAKALGGAKK